MSPRRIIITGGPCTGKSTLIELLAGRGFPVKREVARAEIKRQLAVGSNLLPWQDVQGFSRVVMEKQLEQYRQVPTSGKVIFYDRGVPDLLAYLRKAKIHDALIEEQARHLSYAQPVFAAPPWPEIYNVDNERRESFADMQIIHGHLLAVYHELGYRVVELPFASPAERLQRIEAEL